MDKNAADLQSLVTAETKNIYQVSTVFPFQLFPIVLTLDQKKINIIRTFIFGSGQTTSVLLQDLASVEIATSLFFAELTLAGRLPRSRNISINYLPKTAALKFQQIAEGLIVSEREHVDLSTIPTSQISSQAQTIGRAKMRPSL